MFNELLANDVEGGWDALFSFTWYHCKTEAAPTNPTDLRLSNLNMKWTEREPLSHECWRNNGREEGSQWQTEWRKTNVCHNSVALKCPETACIPGFSACCFGLLHIQYINQAYFKSVPIDKVLSFATWSCGVQEVFWHFHYNPQENEHATHVCSHSSLQNVFHNTLARHVVKTRHCESDEPKTTTERLAAKA